MHSYKSIFWDNDWAHPKYYGWQLVYDTPSFKVLRKQRYLMKRYLILTASADSQSIERMMNELALLGPFSEIILHVFSAGADLSNTLVAGRKLTKAEDRVRILNKATFAIDLSQENESLWQGMSADYRRDCRKAQGQGVTIEIQETPSEPILNEFLQRYTKLAMERGLHVPQRALIERMFANNNLILVYARDGDTVLSMALLYVTKDKAFYLYGINGKKRNDLSGRYLHWEAMGFLKNRGIRWYDLGGVPEIDDKNGIYLFKKRFGGDLISLGTEYQYQPLLVQLAYQTAQKLKALHAWRSTHAERPRSINN